MIHLIGYADFSLTIFNPKYNNKIVLIVSNPSNVTLGNASILFDCLHFVVVAYYETAELLLRLRNMR